jgi:DNA replication protein DnaC
MTRTKNNETVETTAQVQQIQSYLGELKLSKTSELLYDELDRLDKGLSSATQMLLRLLQAQVDYQRERRIERRIRESKLPERKTMVDFDFDFQPGLDRSLVMDLMTTGFVSRRQGVILAGDSGTGKSHIGKALALEGCKQGYRVRYTTAAGMLKILFASLADDSLDHKLKQFLNPDLLVIDELGFDRLEREDARNAALFYKVIDGRYNKASTVLTTNINFEQLGHYLGDPLVTTAIVDRMVHHSTVIVIQGPSWRFEESKKLNKRTQNQEKRPKTAAPKNAAKGSSPKVKTQNKKRKPS